MGEIPSSNIWQGVSVDCIAISIATFILDDSFC
jgi:hypothetical protein